MALATGLRRCLGFDSVAPQEVSSVNEALFYLLGEEDGGVSWLGSSMA